MFEMSDDQLWWAVWTPITVRALNRDEFLKLLQQWERPSTWENAFKASEEWHSMRLSLIELEQKKISENTPDSSKAVEACYTKAIKSNEAAVHRIEEFYSILDTLRRAAPTLLTMAPIVEFRPGEQIDCKAAAASMLAIESAYLQHEKSVGTTSDTSPQTDSGKKKTAKFPRGNPRSLRKDIQEYVDRVLDARKRLKKGESFRKGELRKIAREVTEKNFPKIQPGTESFEKKVDALCRSGRTHLNGIAEK